jgi:phenylacetic acid degradation operon negative regulatory protein
LFQYYATVAILSNVGASMLRAPELVLDLLIANERPLSARALCRAGAIMGLSEVAVRVALTRLCKDRKICQTGRGMYAINLRSGPLLRDVDDWRNKETQLVRWNGAWLAVHDSLVLRSDKTGWRRHSLALALRGFAEFQPGLYLRPDNLAGGIGALRIQLAGLGLSQQALAFCITDLDDKQLARVAKLWKTEALARKYRSLTERLVAHTALLREGAAPALRESLLLGREAIGLIIRDPLLPPQLMASEARRALLQAAMRYQDQGRRLWRAWIRDIDSGGNSGRQHEPL